MKYKIELSISDSRYGGRGMCLSGESDDALGIDIIYSTLVDGYDARPALEAKIYRDGNEITIDDLRAELRTQAQAALDAEKTDDAPAD